MPKNGYEPNESLNLAYAGIDREYAHESAHTRRQLVAGAAVTLGGLAALTVPEIAKAGGPSNESQNILNVAATAEVLATIVNQVGTEKVALGPTELRNVKAAAFEEKIHYDTLIAVGGEPVTRRIWVPDAVFASQRSLLETLEVGDQIFINAYLIGTTVFAGDSALGPKFARYAAEFMGVEAVHRALARQSLGKLGNDRAFMKYRQVERSGAPNDGTPGFTDVNVAVQQLQDAGFGFNEQGDTPGRFYQYGAVAPRVQAIAGVNTRSVA